MPTKLFIEVYPKKHITYWSILKNFYAC